ncbi:unnamed protein product, partial [Didymodactylos carnosus]
VYSSVMQQLPLNVDALSAANEHVLIALISSFLQILLIDSTIFVAVPSHSINTGKRISSDKFFTSSTSIEVDELYVCDYNQLRYTKYQYFNVKSLYVADKLQLVNPSFLDNLGKIIQLSNLKQLTIWNDHPWPFETFERSLVFSPNIHSLTLNADYLLRLLKSSDQICQRLTNMLINELSLGGDDKVWSVDNVELFTHTFSNLESFTIYNVPTANEFYSIMPIILKKFTKLVTLSVFLKSSFLPSKAFVENWLKENTIKLNFYLKCASRGDIVHLWL